MPRSGVTSGRLGKAAVELGISGVAEIKANIAATLDRASGKRFKTEVCMPAAQIAVREIQDMTPVKTGRLKSAIFAALGDPRKPNVLVGVSSKKAPYAHNVEYGHAGPHPAGPHPYFRPGVTSARPSMAESLIIGMKKLIGGGDTVAPSFPQTGGEFL